MKLGEVLKLIAEYKEWRDEDFFSTRQFDWLKDNKDLIREVDFRKLADFHYEKHARCMLPKLVACLEQVSHCLSQWTEFARDDASDVEALADARKVIAEAGEVEGL